MNFEVNDLLKRVDKWKFRLHEKLKTMSPEGRVAFWKQFGLTKPAAVTGSKPKKPRKSPAFAR
jgi:hypothetical protein